MRAWGPKQGPRIDDHDLRMPFVHESKCVFGERKIKRILLPVQNLYVGCTAGSCLIGERIRVVDLISKRQHMNLPCNILYASYSN